jgi:hypothetical protein
MRLLTFFAAPVDETRVFDCYRAAALAFSLVEIFHYLGLSELFIVLGLFGTYLVIL